jgi:hypothetical protein
LRDADERLEYQTRFDSIFQPYGEQAPAPAADERPSAYHRRLMRTVQQRLSPSDERPVRRADGVDAATIGEIARIPIDDLTRTTRTMMSPLFEQAGQMQAAAPHPSTIKPGTLVERFKTDPKTGSRVIEFFGDSFIKSFSQSPQRVTRFIANGKVIAGEPFPDAPTKGLWNQG